MGNAIDDLIMEDEKFKRVLLHKKKNSSDIKLTTLIALKPDLVQFLLPLHFDKDVSGLDREQDEQGKDSIVKTAFGFPYHNRPGANYLSLEIMSFAIDLREKFKEMARALK